VNDFPLMQRFPLLFPLSATFSRRFSPLTPACSPLLGELCISNFFFSVQVRGICHCTECFKPHRRSILYQQPSCTPLRLAGAILHVPCAHPPPPPHFPAFFCACAFFLFTPPRRETHSTNILGKVHVWNCKPRSVSFFHQVFLTRFPGQMCFSRLSTIPFKLRDPPSSLCFPLELVGPCWVSSIRGE